MSAAALECVPDSDEEEHAPLRGPAASHRESDEYEVIVSDDDALAGGRQTAWAAPAALQFHDWQAEEPVGGALRQLNAHLPPPPGSQHYESMGRPRGRAAFTRMAVPPPAKPAAQRSSSSIRPSFRRSMKTAAAVQAERAAAERAAAEEAELAAVLTAEKGAEASDADGLRSVQQQAGAADAEALQAQLCQIASPLGPQIELDPVPAGAHMAPPAVLPAVGPPRLRSAAGGPSFLNRQVLPRAPSRAEELRAKLEQGTSLADTPGSTAGTAVAAAGAAAASKAAAGAGASTAPAGGAGAALEGSTRQHAAVPPQPATSAAAVARAAAGAANSTGMPAGTAAATPARQTARAPATPAAAAAAAAAGPSNPAATYHRTADGLNVVFLNRAAQPAAETAGPSAGGGSKAKGSVNSGWGNNFVRMDLKKGRGSTKYSTKHGGKKRKKGGGRFSSRWQASRLRQVGDGADYLEGWQGSKLRCYKCGGSGHFARDCTAEQQAQADMGALLSSSDEEGSEREGGGGAATASRQQRAAAAATAPLSQQGSAALASRSASLPSSAASWAAPGSSQPAAAAAEPAADPAEQYADVLADPSEEALTGALRAVFGHTAFRGLQLRTVRRLLGGDSLLSIMPTGMGKSLCYQLPALLLPGLTLVVSPLIALMHDQAASVPPPLTTAVLWSGQSRADALQVLADVACGRVKVLFVSPERLNNPHLLDALRPRMPLPLVVVDEAHCVAEWGHSFRPAYFRLGAALAGSVRARRILALTATATKATEAAICQVLRIPGAGVLRDAAVRHNLRLQVTRSSGGASSQASRDRICALFAGAGPLASARSAIVYCAFKEDANQLARLLGARGVSARAYHAGKDYRERAAVEADFAAGRVRVVVATVAFGMGINLARVTGVVHATMPRSLEEYVQQIGRAGRDGSEACCVALLDDGDFVKLRSLAFSGVVDLPAVSGFLAAVFSPAAEGERVRRRGGAAGAKGKSTAAAALATGGSSRRGAGARGRKRKAAADVDPDGEEQGQDGAPPAAPTAGEGGEQAMQQDAAAGQAATESNACPAAEGASPAAVPACGLRRFGVLAVKKLAAELDMREESMEAVLSYLEAEAVPCLRMLPTAALSVKVSFYAAAPEELAQRHAVVQHVLAACPHPRNGVYSAPSAKLAAAAQKAPGLVLQELREMAAGSLIGFELSREEGPAYEILHTPPDLDALAKQVHARLVAVLACQVARLDTSYRALAAAVAAAQAAGAAAGSEGRQAAQEGALRAAVERYFDDAADADAGAGAEAGARGGSSGAAGSDDAAAAVASEEAQDGSATVAPPPIPASLLLDTSGLPLKPPTPALLTAARAVLRSNRQQAGPALSGRALARILHGVGSPAFPPDAWQKRMGAFWGSQAHVDFGAVLRAAEIVARGEEQGPAGGGGGGTEAGDSE